MGPLRYKLPSCHFHNLLPCQNCQVSWQSCILTSAPLDQHNSNHHTPFYQAIREGILIWPGRFCHLDLHILPLLLYLLPPARQNPSEAKQKHKEVCFIQYRFCNGLLLSLAFASIVVIILIMATVIERNCDNNLIEGSLACFATELVSYIPTVYFGIDLLRNIDKKDK